jgi:hypothetical protein
MHHSSDAEFRTFLKNLQHSRDVALVRELVSSALENGHVFEGWSDEDIVNDMLAYADHDIEKYVGSVNDLGTKKRLLKAVSSIKHEIY